MDSDYAVTRVAPFGVLDEAEADAAMPMSIGHCRPDPGES